MVEDYDSIPDTSIKEKEKGKGGGIQRGTSFKGGIQRGTSFKGGVQRGTSFKGGVSGGAGGGGAIDATAGHKGRAILDRKEEKAHTGGAHTGGAPLTRQQSERTRTKPAMDSNPKVISRTKSKF